jgi:hypothetical protein
MVSPCLDFKSRVQECELSSESDSHIAVIVDATSTQHSSDKLGYV